MKKYTIRWIIGLISIALLGLMCVQLYWVNNAINLKKEVFRQSVSSAMSAVVSRLEKREVASAVAQTVRDIPEPEEEPPYPVEQPEPAPALPAHTTRVSSPTQSPSRPSAEQMQNAVSIRVEPSVQTDLLNVQEGTRFFVQQPFVQQQFVQQPMESRLRAMQQYNAALANRQQLNKIRATIPQTDAMHQLVNIDTLRVLLDSAGTSQAFFIASRPQRMAVTYNPSNPSTRTSSRQSAVTIRTRPTNNSLSIRTQSSADGSGNVQIGTTTGMPDASVDWNFTVENMEEQARQLEAHVQNMREALENTFGKEQMMEDFEAFFDVPPPDPKVWVYTNRNNEEQQSQIAQTQQKKPRSEQASVAVSASASRSASQEAVRPVRDRLVSIKDMASRVVMELATGCQPIEQRVSPHLIDSLLKVELVQRGINIPFQYAVLTNDNNFTLALPTAYTGELRKSAFRTALYPNDIITEPHFLSIYFPRQDEFVYESMWGVLATSLVFILLILGCFSLTMMTLFRQKKLSDMKTDFINNMTHEFKTPIATISLASEALRDPAVRGNDNRVMRFINAIHEENKRLGTQVERVLQAAVIDRGEVQLNLASVAVHDVLHQVLQTVALQIESRGGTIECNLEATNDIIEADRVHLANVIINLLDNANKYSPELPVIRLATRNELNGIVISVEDNGIGMSREAQKKIFEKFYRVSTGNLHDVKGFGLGLSYVKAMVEAHGGSISVRSELRHGSHFELYFPYTVQEAVLS